MQSMSRVARASLAVAVLAAGALAAGPAASADDGFRRGPDPTEASVAAPLGAFAVEQLVIPRTAAEGYGGATVYYPADTSEGTFGAVAVAPGYTGTQASIAWLGPRIASQGFVVVTIDTNSPGDSPDRRGDQLLAALDQLRDTAVADRVDPARLAVMGHSMGGGGSLEAAKDRPALRAVVPLTPWSVDKTFPEVAAPTLIIGAEDDIVARARLHAEPMYESLPAGGDKAYLELRDATHDAPVLPDTTIARYGISWLKLYVDDDERYARFLCPAPEPDEQISEYRSTC